MGRVRDEVEERGEAEVKEESVREWGFGKGEDGNGSGSESESESEVGLQLHFLLALSAFPPNFNYYYYFYYLRGSKHQFVLCTLSYLFKNA